MKLPEKVKIGYMTYKIVEWDAAAARERACIGETSHAFAEIRISAATLRNNPMEAANTLLHEILHGIWYVGGMLNSDEEERTVNVIANQLAAVWRDNPEVISWLTDVFAGGRPGP